MGIPLQRQLGLGVEGCMTPAIQRPSERDLVAFSHRKNGALIATALSWTGWLTLIRCSKLEGSFCWMEWQLRHLSIPLGVGQDAGNMHWNWGCRSDVLSLASTLRNIPAQLCIMSTSMQNKQWDKCATLQAGTRDLAMYGKMAESYWINN